MKTLGKVEAILNDYLVLISSTEPLSPDEIVVVYSAIEDPKLREVGYSEPIHYPKGKLQIVYPQKNDLYLAKRFRGTETRTRKVITPSPLSRSLGNLLFQFQPESKEITEEVPGDWSAELNKEQSLNISITNLVSVGDAVGRIK
jgi:hypothetical protein